MIAVWIPTKFVTIHIAVRLSRFWANDLATDRELVPRGDVSAPNPFQLQRRNLGIRDLRLT